MERESEYKMDEQVTSPNTKDKQQVSSQNGSSAGGFT